MNGARISVDSAANLDAGPPTLLKGRVALVGLARNDKGEAVRTRLATPEGYTLTARTSLDAAVRVAAGDLKPGFQTPSLAFGPDAGDLGCGQARSHLSGMSTDQNQHYLPQSYQRGWVDASGRVYVYRWAYNKLVCEPRVTKSTGGRDGLYFIPMAPPGEQNMMEEVFWKRIDQWGADGLALLRTKDPAAAARINKACLSG